MVTDREEKERNGRKMLMTSKNREGEEVKFMVMMVTEARRAAMEIQMARRGRSCPWYEEEKMVRKSLPWLWFWSREKKQPQTQPAAAARPASNGSIHNCQPIIHQKKDKDQQP